MIVPGGDLERRGVVAVEGVREVEGRDGVMGGQRLSRATGSARLSGASSDPTRGMITMASGTPSARHSAAIAPRVPS